MTTSTRIILSLTWFLKAKIFNYWILGDLFRNTIGLVPKNIYQSCVKYVQQVPIVIGQLPKEVHFKKLIFYTMNKAKNRDFYTFSYAHNISIASLQCLTLFTIQNLDLSSMTYEDKSKPIENSPVTTDFMDVIEELSFDGFEQQIVNFVASAHIPSLRKHDLITSTESLEYYGTFIYSAICELEELHIRD